MGKYILRRIGFLIPVLALVSVLGFAILLALPGDPLDTLVIGDPNITQADVQQMRDVYGLDDPLPVQYGKWISQLVQGNAGFSRQYRIPVTDLVGPALRNTLVLAGLALLFSVIISIPIGIYSAIRPYSPGDHAFTIFSFVGYALPNFWLGLVLIMVFAVTLGWLPAGGISSAVTDADLWATLVDRARHLLLPVVVLGLSTMALWTRYMRSSLLEVVGEDYILTARSKGLPKSTVINRHALRNALLPMISLTANTIQLLAGGSVVVEKVFSYPGIGKMLFDSIMGNDYSVALAILLIMSLLVVGLNLVADLLYGILDPRIRYE